MRSGTNWIMKDGLCVLHKDGDRRNNHFSNLSTGKQSEMAKKAYKGAAYKTDGIRGVCIKKEKHGTQ